MLIILGLVAAAILLFLVLKNSAPLEIAKVFGLDTADFEIISSDLGKGHPRKRLYGVNLVGEPDAILRGKRTGQIVICEFKNRKYKGYVRRREYYQVILYIGLARLAFCTENVVAVLAFNDARVEISFDQDVFNGLKAMRSEVITSLSAGKATDRRPLHKRMPINPRNRSIRFPR